MQKWVRSLTEKVRTKDHKWKPNTFLVDDPSLDVSVVREAFQCWVLFCVWRGLRALIRSIFKKCCNIDVQKEMFKHLACILFSGKSGPIVADAVEEFMHVYVDQSIFMEYFKRKWVPCIDLWVNSLRSLPMASMELLAAIEFYHLRLKSKFFNEQDMNSLEELTGWSTY
ncbi:hypothetical protein K2173_005748 [Erythroxylum novogranatense]|uniref:Uncharacterized protein n=1 Tax=Erythroxylum novogranatense TaxID=1862640 RepID=A0AAV8U2J9_9ROSI|nr:hypothetical protein K2173_005748 [Erythroxylum novogranatense]